MKNLNSVLRRVVAQLKLEKRPNFTGMKLDEAIFMSLYKWGYLAISGKEIDDAYNLFPSMINLNGGCGLCQLFNIGGSCDKCPLNSLWGESCNVSDSLWKQHVNSNDVEERQRIAKELLNNIEDVLDAYLVCTATTVGKEVMNDPCGTDYVVLEQAYKKYFVDVLDKGYAAFDAQVMDKSPNAKKVHDDFQVWKGERQVDTKQESVKKEKAFTIPGLFFDFDYNPGVVLLSSSLCRIPTLPALHSINSADEVYAMGDIDLESLEEAVFVKVPHNELEPGDVYIRSDHDIDNTIWHIRTYGKTWRLSIAGRNVDRSLTGSFPTALPYAYANVYKAVSQDKAEGYQVIEV